VTDSRLGDDRLRDLIGAWALDAVDDTERADFEAYLLRDDDARAEATELADTAVLLAAVAPAEAPPAALKTRLLDAIEGLPQAEGVTPASAEPVPASTAPAASASIASRSTGREGRVYRFTRRTAAMFALAAVALVGITVGGIAIRNATTISSEASAISAIRSADDARTARATVTGGGSAELVWSAGQHRSAITLSGVKTTTGGKVYQLWYIDAKGTPVSAGTFTRGSGEQSVLLDGRYRTGDTIGMTVEPKGGSTAPTTTPVVAIATT
jgi:anti-sigma-K factor RskA